MARKRFIKKGKKDIRAKKKDYKRKYNINLGKLKDSKINTIIEKKMQQIALDEASKLVQKLIFRKFLFGTYDPYTNAAQLGSPIDWNGQNTPLCNIQKVDNATMLTVPPVNVPTTDTPSTWTNPGSNLIGNLTGYDGFRRGNIIKVHGIGLHFKVAMASVPFDKTETFARPDNVVLYWNITRTMYEGQELAEVRPSPKDCLNIPIFGFSKRLDYAASYVSLPSEIRRQVVASGKIKMRTSTTSAYTIDKKVYIDLSNKPFTVQYHHADQNGTVIEGMKPMFNVRSNVCDIPEYDDYRPRLRACIKTYYTDT